MGEAENIITLWADDIQWCCHHVIWSCHSSSSNSRSSTTVDHSSVSWWIFVLLYCSGRQFKFLSEHLSSDFFETLIKISGLLLIVSTNLTDVYQSLINPNNCRIKNLETNFHCIINFLLVTSFYPAHLKDVHFRSLYSGDFLYSTLNALSLETCKFASNYSCVLYSDQCMVSNWRILFTTWRILDNNVKILMGHLKAQIEKAKKLKNIVNTIRTKQQTWTARDFGRIRNRL